MSLIRDLLVTYLLNSAWQVPLLWMAATLSARLLHSHRTTLLHRLWVGTLLAQVTLPAFATFQPRLGVLLGDRSISWIRALFARLFSAPTGTGDAKVTVTFGPTVTSGMLHLPNALLTGLALAYAGLLLMAAVRLVFGMRRTAYLRTEALPVRLSEPQQALWDQCREHLGVPAATLLESAAAGVPMTLGVIRPVVLLPPGLLDRSSSAETQALFAHELAHIQRADFGLNLGYQVLALSLAYHPLLRPTLRRLAESREWVCDDLAANIVGTPVLYARSLLRLATQLLPAPPVVSTHAIGMLDANALERRVMQLTRGSKAESVLQRTATLAFSGLIGLATCGTAWAWRTGVPLPAYQAAADPQTAPSPQAAGSQPTGNSRSVQIPGRVMAGQRRTAVNPVYPPEAKKAGLTGSVVMHATISPEGTIQELHVVSGPKELAQAAVEAVKQWTYQPYLLNGTPVEVTTTITVNFQMAH